VKVPIVPSSIEEEFLPENSPKNRTLSYPGPPVPTVTVCPAPTVPRGLVHAYNRTVAPPAEVYGEVGTAVQVLLLESDIVVKPPEEAITTATSPATLVIPEVVSVEATWLSAIVPSLNAI
jgi:hypothetical protein